MMPTPANPYENTRMANFLTKRVDDLVHLKSQKDIAREVGLANPNVISMWKSGRNKVPLDRVRGLAQALETDAAEMFLMAMEQDLDDASMSVIREIFGIVLTENEREWVRALRRASVGRDPSLTAMRRKILYAIFANDGR
jgi:transcriptional regulator with XRE-family HTH domain